MAINYTTLATEINTDPKSLGYAGKSDYEIAGLLNTPGLSSETVFRTYTPIEDIVAGIVRSEYDTLLATDKAYLNSVILPCAKLKTGVALIRTQVGQIFGAGTTTRANLTAAASKSATRGEVLFGENTTISDADVAKALRG